MKRRTSEDLQGQYLLNGMAALTRNGDAYVSSDQLYRVSKRNYKALNYEQFLNDRAFLLTNGYLHFEGPRLYLQHTWEYETAAAKCLAELLTNNDLTEPSLPEVLVSQGITLTEEQREAVRMALSHRLSIILGGAGSGKTTLIKAIVEHRPAQNLGVVLCAPTGKASCNLTERTGLRARTVHSALGKVPDDDFLAEEIDWRYTDLVVVDEASMLTTEMLAGILSVANPCCHVVLIGDPNQLLSVGSGNVLPDLLTLGVPRCRLKSFHRQTDTDSALACNVRDFDRCRSVDDLRFDKSFHFVPLHNDDDIRRCICRGAVPIFKAGMDVQILSPYNSTGILSADALSVTFRELLNPATPENTLEGDFLRSGDRVIILQNDWKQGVCNGDIGTYDHLRQENGVLVYAVACSRGRAASWGSEHSNPLVNLRLAYTITIHKSQGSEYDMVILPISRAFSNMLHRNLLYTAISRARQRVVIVGDADALNTALQREMPPRKSMLVTKTHSYQEYAA